MNNRIAADLPDLLRQAGFQNIETLPADEHYQKGMEGFKQHLGIWSKVAGLRQMVEEGYLEDALRLKAIEEYNHWIENEAVSMTLTLNDVRGHAVKGKQKQGVVFEGVGLLLFLQEYWIILFPEKEYGF